LQAAGGEWTWEPTAVELRWTGDGTAFFRTLIGEAFRLSDDGRFWFLGLGHPDEQGDRGLTLQDAVLSTFLQHGRTRAADAGNAPRGALAVEIDGQTATFRYRRVQAYAQQGAAFAPRKPNEVVGWQSPGGAVRHSAFSADTSRTDEPGPWLALLFAPVGAIYFRLRKRTVGVRPQFCIALPDLGDLAAHARVRHCFLRGGVRDLLTSGPADAALRVLATLESEGMLSDPRTARCRVVAFGAVAWAAQQKTPVDVVEVELARVAALVFYRRAMRLLPPVKSPEWTERAGRVPNDEAGPGRPRWEVSPVLDLIAGNLILGQPWWRRVHQLAADTESWRQLGWYEFSLRGADAGGAARGVAAVVALPDAFDDESARIFVQACHRAWRRRMGILAERARERGESRRVLINREFERLRLAFARCKNAATLRATMTDFWARAGGPIPELQAGWRTILPYLTERRWREARDLALLALVSYAPIEADADEPPADADGAPGVTGDADRDGPAED
jgi:CRISPR-associated protein Cas8a1/Csx13